MKVSYIRLAISVVVLAASYLLFEVQNVWPFNQETVPILRAIFLVAIAGSLIGIIKNNGWFASLSLLAGFAVTTLLSNARITTTYLLMVAGFVIAIWAINSLRRPQT